ncbi:nuclear transport factor 2 family protein [soil metagenome]
MPSRADSGDLQAAKGLVLDFFDALDRADDHDVAGVLGTYATSDHRWRGVHPFGEVVGAHAAADRFWLPLRRAFAPLQRRPDVFLAGRSSPTVERGEPGAVWVCQMGHLIGLFDQSWLDIPPTRRMCCLRYVEFHRVTGGQIAESATFVDVLDVMRQAGHYPLPPPMGADHVQLGPRSHDGILLEPRDPDEGARTMAVIEHMMGGLAVANADPDNRMPRAVLAESWHDDMVWHGPAGIGTTYTIDRYQQQHQYPFRTNMADKQFRGHLARIAEGDYGCFFGWPNLINTPLGGFLGLTGGAVPAEMRVVDVYRREGDKLAENWVFIDVPHWLAMQGLDVLQRMRQLHGIEEI